MRNRNMHFLRPIILLAVIVFIGIPTLCVTTAEAQGRTVIKTGPSGGWQGGSFTVNPGEKLIINQNPTLSIKLSPTLSSSNFVATPEVKPNGSTSIEPKDTPVIVKLVGENQISIEPITVPPPGPSEYPVRALYLCITEGSHDQGTKSCDEIVTFYLFSIVEPLPGLRSTLEGIPSLPALKPPPGGEDIGAELNRLIAEANGLLKTSKFKEAKEKYSISLAKLHVLLALVDVNTSRQLQQTAECVEKWMSYCDAKMLQANSDNEAALQKFRVLSEADSQDCGELSVTALFEMGYTNKKMGRPETALELCSRALSLCNNLNLKAFIHMNIALMLHSLYSRENTLYAQSHDHFMAALKIVRDTGTKVLIHMSYASALQRFNKNAALRELDEAESICKEKPSECGNDKLDQIAADRRLYITPPVKPQAPQPTENVRQKPFMRWFIIIIIGLIVAIILIFKVMHSLKTNIKHRFANRPAARVEVARYAFMSRFRNYLEIKLTKLTKFEIQIERLIDDILQSNDLYYRFNEESFDPYLQRVEVSLSDSEKTSIVNISVYYNGQQLLHDVVDLEDYRLT